MSEDRVRHIEFVLFLAGWSLVLIAGMELPVRLTVMIEVFIVIGAFVQDIWLRWLFGHLIREGTFFKNLALYALLGFAASVGIVLSDPEVASSTHMTFLWILICVLCMMLYGIFFWIVNRQVKKYFIRQKSRK